LHDLFLDEQEGEKKVAAKYGHRRASALISSASSSSFAQVETLLLATTFSTGMSNATTLRG
jgi:hypothetical protein